MGERVWSRILQDKDRRDVRIIYVAKTTKKIDAFQQLARIKKRRRPHFNSSLRYWIRFLQKAESSGVIVFVY